MSQCTGGAFYYDQDITDNSSLNSLNEQRLLIDGLAVDTLLCPDTWRANTQITIKESMSCNCVNLCSQTESELQQ